MVAAADVARQETLLSAATRREIEARTAEISATLDGILNPAVNQLGTLEPALIPLMTSIYAAQHSGRLMLPTSTSSPTVTSTVTPTATQTPTPTPSPEGMNNLIPHPIEAQNSGDVSWDENNDCSNLPPTWVPAQGWRARCEGAPRPQDESTEEGNRSAEGGPSPHAGPTG
jgi:hypothetical protein